VPNGIATRQNTPILFSSIKPLAVGASIVSQPIIIGGFARVMFSIFADQPFTLLVEEGNDGDGPWTPVVSLNSSPEGAFHRIATKISPVGGFMRQTIQNTAIAEKFISAVTYGLPL
jgi:hypothetical protein